MFLARYDRNTGDDPVIGDRVETCHFGPAYKDGEFTGIFAGWASQPLGSAIVILDKPLSSTGQLALVVTIACLRKTDNMTAKPREKRWPNVRHESHKSVRFSDASTFDFICDDCGATDDVTSGWGLLRKPCTK
jgi:hypothetical protein